MVSVGQLVAKKGRKSHKQRQQLAHVLPLSRFVLEVLEKRQITPRQFAQASNIGKSTIYNIIAATHEPTRLTMQRLAHDLSVVSGRIITSQELDSLLYGGIGDSLNAREERSPAIANLPVGGSLHERSPDPLITNRSNSDLLRGNINKSGSVMTHSSSDEHHGLKLFAATLKVARMHVRGEIAGVPVSNPATLEEICTIMADLTPIETITPDILNLAETGHLDALPGELIPGVAALQYVTDENDRSYTSAELSRIVLGELIPINKQTGQPFTAADLSELGVHQNNCSSSLT